jgi:signal transduction histidine kinase
MLYLGSILDDISHQIRNPVLTIGGFARRLMKTGVRRPDYTEVILEEAARLELLVTTLTEFTNMPKPSFVKLSFAQLLDRIKEAVDRIVAEVGIAIDLLEYDRMDDVIMVCDPRLFSVAFENVLRNAVESLHDKDMNHGVSVSVHKGDTGEFACVVTVSDHGEGIRDTVLSRVFHPFFSTKTGHVGMGLTFTKQIMEELGGDVTIESEFLKGTTVSLCIPGDRRRNIRRMPLGDGRL